MNIGDMEMKRKTLSINKTEVELINSTSYCIDEFEKMIKLAVKLVGVTGKITVELKRGTGGRIAGYAISNFTAVRADSHRIAHTLIHELIHIKDLIENAHFSGYNKKHSNRPHEIRAIKGTENIFKQMSNESEELKILEYNWYRKICAEKEKKRIEKRENQRNKGISISFTGEKYIDLTFEIDQLDLDNNKLKQFIINRLEKRTNGAVLKVTPNDVKHYSNYINELAQLLDGWWESQYNRLLNFKQMINR